MNEMGGAQIIIAACMAVLHPPESVESMANLSRSNIKDANKKSGLGLRKLRMNSRATFSSMTCVPMLETAGARRNENKR